MIDDSRENALILQKMGWLCKDIGDVLLPEAVIVYFTDECTCAPTRNQKASHYLISSSDTLSCSVVENVMHLC